MERKAAAAVRLVLPQAMKREAPNYLRTGRRYKVRFLIEEKVSAKKRRGKRKW